MTMTTSTHDAPLTDEQENAVARKNAILLSICQAVNGSAAPLSIALGGLTGSYLLGVDKSLATAPVTGFNIGVALMSTSCGHADAENRPKTRFHERCRYRNVCHAAGGIFDQHSVLLAVRSRFMLAGSSNSFAQQYRFAAADRGTKEFKAKGISIVLIGGIAAAIIGPQMILNFRDYLAPIPFAGAFLWGTGLFVISLFRHAVS